MHPSPVSFSFTCIQNLMTKKFLLAILVSLFLVSCISITKDSENPVSQHNFVTATLAPTATTWVSATPTTLPVTNTPSLATSTPANCTDATILLRDVTIPDNTQVKAGEKFTKTWEFQNTGTCPWKNYTIGFFAGETMNAPLSAPIPDTLPNEKVQVSLELTAPSADGLYTASFTLNDLNGIVIPIGLEKYFWVKIVVGAVTAYFPAPSSIDSGNTNCIHSQNAGYVSEVISLINQARADTNIPALTVNAELTTIAQNHAEDMAYKNFLSHDGSDGSFGERMVGKNIFGEILAIGTPQDAMNQWRRDEHWDYVLGNYTQIGVGYAYNSCSDFGGYFTVDFGY